MARGKNKTLKSESSPNWTPNTKLIVGLTFILIIGALVRKFQYLVSPLLITFMLIYILHPVASYMVDKWKLSWKSSVNVIYLGFILILIVSVSAGGVALISQLRNLIGTVESVVDDSLVFVNDLVNGTTSYTLTLFDYSVDVSDMIAQTEFDINSMVEKLGDFANAMFGELGSFLRVLATSAGWGAFIFAISYFILIDMGRSPSLLKDIDIPGHLVDLDRLGHELNRIWNAYFRGQFAIFLMVSVSVFTLLSILGVNNALGLALVAGLGKFIPYIGPFTASVSTTLVAFFQNSNFFGVEQWVFAIIVIACMIILDQTFDAVIIPRMMGQSLGVHPAAILVAAIISASLIGVIGLPLAAPVLASAQLISKFAIRKMLDLDPWPKPKEGHIDINYPFEDTFRQLSTYIKNKFKFRKRKK